MAQGKTSYSSVCAVLAAVALSGCLSEWVIVEAPDVAYASITTGAAHACGLTAEGEVFCWSLTDSRPTLVSGSLRFASVSTFGDHTCGVSATGGAYCWGYNQFGQLGTASDLETCRRPFSRLTVPCSRQPVVVETVVTWQTVSVGWGHSCGLDADGRAYCWGLNSKGQLGAASVGSCTTGSATGSVPCSAEPVAVDGELTFASISAGTRHNCGVTSDGSAYCWGAGGSGRLGTGSVDDSPSPALVAGNLSFRSVSAGGAHTCGITTERVVYCWGSNHGLQLGSRGGDIGCGSPYLFCVTTPRRLQSALRFVQLTTSYAISRGGPALGGHTCGIATDGEVYCWGLNEGGQLGGSNEFATADPVRLPVELTFTELNAGLENTCGVTTGAAVYCWAYGTPWSRWVEPSN